MSRLKGSVTVKMKRFTSTNVITLVRLEFPTKAMLKVKIFSVCEAMFSGES